MTFSLSTYSVICYHFPLWNEGIRYHFSYDTNIIKGITGKEQRTSLTDVMKRTISFVVETNGHQETSRFKRDLMTYKNSIWDVPLWNYQTSLTVAAAIGATSLTVEDDTDYLDYTNTRTTEVMIAQNYSKYNIKTKASSSSTTITLSAALTLNFPVKSIVVPMMLGLLDDVTPMSVIHPDYMKVQLSFKESFRGVDA